MLFGEPDRELVELRLIRELLLEKIAISPRSGTIRFHQIDLVHEDKDADRLADAEQRRRIDLDL